MSPFIWIAISVIPISLYSGSVFLLWPHLHTVDFPFTNVPMTTQPFRGFNISWLIVFANITFLFVIIGRGTLTIYRSTDNKLRRRLSIAPLVVIPGMSFLWGLTFPMYFTVYLAFFLIYAHFESKVIHHLFGNNVDSNLWLGDPEDLEDEDEESDSTELLVK